MAMEGFDLLEAVYYHIETVYNDADEDAVAESNNWLEEFQNSTYAWDTSVEILQKKRDVKSCYYAAQVLRRKTRTSLDELGDEDSYAALKNALMTQLTRFPEESESVIELELYLAVADLVLLLGSWQQPIPELLSSALDAPQLIRVMAFVVEEMDSGDLRMGRKRRRQFLRHLRAVAPQVLELLGSCLREPATNNELVMTDTFSCLASWISRKLIRFETVMNHPLGQQMFLVLATEDASEQLHSNAENCLYAMLNSLNNYINRPMELRLLNAVCALEPAYHSSVARGEVAKTMHFARIFITLCEAFLDCMLLSLEQPHPILRGLDLVLLCVEHDEYQVAQLSFDLWNRISNELFRRRNSQLVDYFKQYIQRLLAVLYRRSQMEADHQGLAGELPDFHAFREKVGFVIKRTVFVVGAKDYFAEMFAVYQTPSSPWQTSEAATFVMKNVAESLSPDDAMPQVIDDILGLPESAPVAARYTSLLLLGELSHWTANRAETLQQVLDVLYLSIERTNGLAPAAATALIAVCRKCTQELAVSVNGLIAVVRNLDSYAVSNDLSVELLKGVSLVVSLLPRPELEAALGEVMSLQLQPLAELVQSTNSSASAEARDDTKDPALWIDRAGAVIKNTRPVLAEGELHPVLQVFTDAWPMLLQLLQAYSADARITERTCDLIRSALRKVQHQATTLVEPLARELPALYSAQGHSCFIYLGSVLVDVAGSNGGSIRALLRMMEAFAEPAITTLSEEDGPKNNVYLVQDFLRLCLRFVQRSPTHFFGTGHAKNIFMCALVSCSVEYHAALSAAMDLVGSFLKCGLKTGQAMNEARALVAEACHELGDHLVVYMLQVALRRTDIFMLRGVAKVLEHFKNLVTSHFLARCLWDAVSALPTTNNAGCVTATERQREKFCVRVLKSNSAEEIAVALLNFTSLFT